MYLALPGWLGVDHHPSLAGITDNAQQKMEEIPMSQFNAPWLCALAW
jgi:hypothetical protein